VAELGPRAAAWAGWLRRTYPGAPPYGIARLAARQARRHSYALAAVQVSGALAVVLHLPATTWVRATLVLRIATATVAAGWRWPGPPSAGPAAGA
jgi:hypothetical protein